MGLEHNITIAPFSVFINALGYNQVANSLNTKYANTDWRELFTDVYFF
jgi:hypothetical protein